MPLLIASNNSGKIAEIRALFPELRVISPADHGLDIQVAEEGRTFFENAYLKACAFATASDLVSMADDSGLEIDALGGAPGIHSARFGGKGLNDEDRCELVLGQLRDVSPARRQARFRCCIVIVGPDGRLISSQGTCQGRISQHPRGDNGFGYDPVFYLSSHQKTMAELPSEEKNRISHRAAAIRLIGPGLLSAFPKLREDLP